MPDELDGPWKLPVWEQPRTLAERFQPTEGSMVEFWCRGMAKQGRAGTGIRGWFRDGLFWSLDDADHYAPGEVTSWLNLRNAFQCAARGRDGCRVCTPGARTLAREAAAEIEAGNAQVTGRP